MSNLSDMAEDFIEDFILANDLKEGLTKKQRKELTKIYDSIFVGITDCKIAIPYNLSDIEMDFANFILGIYFTYLRLDSEYLHFITDTIGEELSKELFSINIEAGDAEEKLKNVLRKSSTKISIDNANSELVS